MQTKLTLRMDDHLINTAKSIAGQQGKSLSRMVADYFKLLAKKDDHSVKTDLPPHVKALSGALKGASLDEKDHKKHLESKYL